MPPGTKTGVKFSGLEEASALVLLNSRVPAAVPSVIQSSRPRKPSSAQKTTLPSAMRVSVPGSEEAAPSLMSSSRLVSPVTVSRAQSSRP